LISYSFKWFGLLAILLFLSACQTPRKVSTTNNSQGWLTNGAIFKQGYKQFQGLGEWRYSAKVGIVTPEEKQQANLIWAANEQGLNIVRLFGPLGLGAIKIEFDDNYVVLSNRKGELHRGDNAQYLLESIVGWPIPVEALEYWLFSLPQPNQTYAYRLDEERRISSMRQLGWTINFSDYRDYYGNGTFLARKIIAEKQVTPEQAITVTLITKNWK